MITKITENIKYVGCDDPELDLFESQYSLPEGMCYNSYVIIDKHPTILDTIDNRCEEEWLQNLLLMDKNQSILSYTTWSLTTLLVLRL